ncbi:TonB-dependent receptor [Pontibacter sp. G13]|uniref:SusC/RagA family TonB-linked outer membrane protein n=1 Tax=Pontibacter sp. G13 TaxID=3074898 RepID=UPI00288936C2|nr:TonB-dependent receptor [Pontibacter sp. G13]WNJ20435.1 TonB-dependent receptor [Pontibacter sp. G13]
MKLLQLAKRVVACLAITFGVWCVPTQAKTCEHCPHEIGQSAYKISPWEPIQVLDQTINGTITNEDGEPLANATVRAEGTTIGALSDDQGRFSLSIPDDVTSLIVSYYGYEPQTVEIAGRSTINIVMLAESSSLEEIVVVGYGTSKKSDLTGSLAKVSSADFEQQPLTRMDQALQGRAAGVNVTQTSGAPGAGFKIRIRGANSISGNNTPLYVVDGLVVGDINSLNVNDIASMEVLKDASATAIYGSRGANGVVLITTKSGQAGTPKVEFETFMGVSQVAQTLDLMTPAEFAEGVNFAEGTELFTAEEIEALRAGGGENWQDRFFQPGSFYNAQLALSGGSEKTDYYFSGNYYQAAGTIIDQDYVRYTLRANINSKLSDRVKVGLNTFLSRDENTGVRANLATGLSWDPTTPAFTEEGDYNFTPLKPGVGNGTINPLVAPENNVRHNIDHQIVANGYVDVKLLDNLVLNVSAGVEQLNIAQNGYTSLLVNNTGNATVLNRDVNRYQNTNRLTYTYDEGANHRFQIDAVHEQQYVTRVWTEATASGFFSDNTTYKDLSLGAVQRIANNSNSESLQSFLGRANYAFKEKYLFTASVRADGSSKFQEGNRWGVFPSGSAAWRVSEEAFLQDVSVINNLKLRASFGVTGSQAINPLATRAIPIIDPSVNYPFSGGAASIGVAPSNQLANPDLTWETTTQVNGGFDLGLWNSKFTLSFDAYRKHTTDLLLQRILPSYVGPSFVTQNVGEVENQGFDIMLGLVLVDEGDWHVSSNFNLSRNRNQVLALVDGDEPLELGGIYYTNTFPVNPTRVEVGLPISSFRGYVFEGVYQLGEEEEAEAFGRVPGDAKYQDVNGDGIISTDDIVTIGDGNPDFTWGWNWTASWKNLELNFLLVGSQGNEIYNFQRMRMMGLGAGQFHAVHADYNDRWTPDNPSDIPSGRDGTEFLSSQFLEDGSFVSLKNVALGYTFADGFPKIGLDQLRLFASGENLFILTKYTGFDPESTASGGSDVDLGIDYNAYPISRSFSFGLRATF